MKKYQPDYDIPNSTPNQSMMINNDVIAHVTELVNTSRQDMLAENFPVRQSVSYHIWQQAMDIFFGLAGLVALVLLLPLLAVAIYTDSPGPIFYSQERLGYQKKPFRMYKLRSMHTEAERQGQAVWAGKSDDRVTRVGRWLRQTHLDELPQVCNILCGQMSLIGPRPEREVYATHLEEMQPLYRYRFSVKPGLTGWTQVTFGYGETENDELVKLQYDLYYIKNQSFRLDISIIVKTVIEIVGGYGR